MSSRPVRVCYLIDNLAVAGTEKRLLALLADLDRNKVSPYLCLLDGQRPEGEKGKGSGERRREATQ